MQRYQVGSMCSVSSEMDLTEEHSRILQAPDPESPRTLGRQGQNYVFDSLCGGNHELSCWNSWQC